MKTAGRTWDEDLAVIKAMRAYGGSFVQALAQAALLADENNLKRIKDAFPDYWKRYAEMAKLHKETGE